MYVKPAIGPGSEELLLASAQDKYPTDWSPDGRFLLYNNTDPKIGYDIGAVPVVGDRKPFPVVQTEFEGFYVGSVMGRAACHPRDGRLIDFLIKEPARCAEVPGGVGVP